jgi:hypothetical protein
MLLRSGGVLGLLTGAIWGTSSCGEQADAAPAPAEACEVVDCGVECSHNEDCPEGTYCSDDGACVADCTPDGGQCPNGYFCNSRGRCIELPEELPVLIDAGLPDTGPTGTSCVEVDLQLERGTVTVLLLIDRSDSMRLPLMERDDQLNRWEVIWFTLMDEAEGIVNPLQDEVRFGMMQYVGNPYGEPICPHILLEPVSLSNYDDIESSYERAYGWAKGNTPTGEAVIEATAYLRSVEEEGQKVIVLATDGVPNTCADAYDQVGGQALSVGAIEDAHRAGILTFVVGVSDGLSVEHLQDLANAGVGLPVGGERNATTYQALEEQQLVDAFTDIVSGVRSCIFELNGEVEQGDESTGTVTLDGEVLGYQEENGWRLPSPTTIELMGSACQAIQFDDHEISVRFPCESMATMPW